MPSPAPRVVVAHGSATREAQADHAVVRLRVSAVDADPTPAINAAAAAVRELTERLPTSGVEHKGYGVRTFTRLGVDQVTLHVAEIPLEVTVSDLDALEEVIRAAVVTELVDVAHVDWQLRERRELVRQARAAAADEASQAALDYAAALGLRVREVVEIATLPSSSSGRNGGPATTFGAVAGTAGPVAALDLSPRPIVVCEAVTITFRLDEPASDLSDDPRDPRGG